MSEELNGLFESYLNEDLVLIVASNPAVKGEGIPVKMKIRPVTIKGRLVFHATRTVGAQELHENGDAASTAALLLGMIGEGPRFGQIELKNSQKTATVLISRKGHVTVKERKVMSAVATDAGSPDRKKN